MIIPDITASLSEFKQDPLATVAAGNGATVAILDGDEPVFYCVPAPAYEAMLERLDDLDLNAIADARANDPVIKMTLAELP